MNIHVKENTITLGKRSVLFEYPIKKYLISNSACVILLKIPVGIIYNENVFGIVNETLQWQIDEIDYLHANSPYVDILEQSCKIRLLNWDGTQLLLEPETGKILDKKWFK